MNRREILKRTLNVNAYWGIGNTGCHDVGIESSPPSNEVETGRESYTVSLDLETGELSPQPLESQ